jgi:hypothetical protein
MNEIEEFVPADSRERIKFFIALALWIVAYFVVKNALDDIFARNHALIELNPEQALNNMLNITLILILLKCIFYTCISILFVQMGIRVKKSGRWPPLGMKMPFKTKIRKDRRYIKLSVISLFGMPVILFVNIIVSLYFWYETLYQISNL